MRSSAFAWGRLVEQHVVTGEDRGMGMVCAIYEQAKGRLKQAAFLRVDL